MFQTNLRLLKSFKTTNAGGLNNYRPITLRIFSSTDLLLRLNCLAYLMTEEAFLLSDHLGFFLQAFLEIAHIYHCAEGQSVIVKVVVLNQIFHKLFQLPHIMPVTFIVLLTAEEKPSWRASTLRNYFRLCASNEPSENKCHSSSLILKGSQFSDFTLRCAPSSTQRAH
ncbi:hypothetical protein [Escherichia coli]|uniref:hypothetical protein n=1 Tax=Escherichia coli TaxID=562 RepID=UPI001600FFB8|nr:hypothetical protein [Escherichia coli]MBB2143791.1 hypothetical protein [Escherichia coli]